MVKVTQALVMTTSLIDDPIVANVDARIACLFVAAAHVMNSSPARDVSNIQDQPVNDIGNAPMEPSFIFAMIMTNTPQTKMNKSMAVALGIPMINAFSTASADSTKGGKSNGIGLKTRMDV